MLTILSTRSGVGCMGGLGRRLGAAFCCDRSHNILYWHAIYARDSFEKERLILRKGIQQWLSKHAHRLFPGMSKDAKAEIIGEKDVVVAVR
jgi:hypothetical protein